MITERIGPTKHGVIGNTYCVDGIAYGPQRRVLHACERCGFVRCVKYRPYMKSGTEVGGSVGSSHCAACHYESRMRHYQDLVDENRRRANNARAKQAMKRLEPYKTKG